jgi:hypothetical protein
MAVAATIKIVLNMGFLKKRVGFRNRSHFSLTSHGSKSVAPRADKLHMVVARLGCCEMYSHGQPGESPSAISEKISVCLITPEKFYSIALSLYFSFNQS